MAKTVLQQTPTPRAAVLRMSAYHPPLGGRQGLRLDFNENTVACSPRVLEALGNGLQVLYTTCPAVEGLEVSSARQVVIEDMGKAVAGAVAAGPAARVPEPAVAREFGIAAVTARIDDLYERLAARRSLRTAASRRRRRARQHAGSQPLRTARAGRRQP